MPEEMRNADDSHCGQPEFNRPKDGWYILGKFALRVGHGEFCRKAYPATL